MKHSRFLCCCLFTWFVWITGSFVYAQNNDHTSDRLSVTDSLKKVLPLLKDTQRLDVLIQLIDKTKHSDPQEALAYGQETKLLLSKIQYPVTRAKGYKNVGNAYFYAGDYPNALFHYLMALRLYENRKDTPSIILVYNNIGAVNIVVGRNDLAKKNFLIALNLGKTTGLPPNKFLYNNIGNLFFEEKNYSECIRYFKQALAIEEKEDSNATERCIMLNNIGESYNIKGDLDSAALYFNKVLAIPHIDPYYTASAYSGLGKVATARNQFSAAEQWLTRAEEIASAHQFITVHVEVLKAFSILYKKENQFEKALEYYIRYHTLSDSAYTTDVRKRVDQMQVKYDAQKKNEQITVLNKDKQLALAESEKRGATRNLFMAAFIFTLVVSFVLYRNNHLKKRINTMLSETNARISEDNTKLQHDNIMAKYEVLKSKTDPHFLFNSLSTLSALVAPNPDAVEYIKRFSDLYRMILETESKTLISLDQEMQVVHHYLYLQKMRFRDKLIVDIDVPAEYLNKTIPSFSIQMVVENAIKHNIISRLRNLTIKLYTEGEYVVITNNLQRKHDPVTSTLTGIRSIMGRYALLTPVQPVFTETDTTYIVKLPLFDHLYKNPLPPEHLIQNNQTL